jgi:RimJ/RimL family protein N-acetyltransferase
VAFTASTAEHRHSRPASVGNGCDACISGWESGRKKDADIMTMSELNIETARLHLRLMRPSDLDELMNIFGDPKVMASFHTDPFSRTQMQHWLEGNLEHQTTYGYGLFSVVLKSEGVLIGDCGLEHMTVDGNQVTELGYDFRSDYWNRGFATEAATAVRDYAFDTLHLPGLISLIRIGNQASRRVSEKIGMHFVAEMRRNEIAYWKYATENERFLDNKAA